MVSGDRIEIRVTGDVGDVAADVATPLAVVLAELLQNAVEHAFPSVGGDSVFIAENDGEAVGHVELVLASDAHRLTLQVRDDGCGLPEGFDIDHTTSLGLSIVRDLVTSQLGGSIVMQSNGGTLVTIDLPIEKPSNDDTSSLEIPRAVQDSCPAVRLTGRWHRTREHW